MNKLFLSLVLTRMLLHGSLLGQTPATTRPIVGTVQDTSGAAVTGTSVALDRPDGSEIMHTITDGAGGFQFKNVPRGTYLVDVRQKGFKETKGNVVADSAGRPAVRIVLPVAGVEEQVNVGASDTSAQVTTEIGQNHRDNGS
jgi:hypothetical protein